MTTANVDIQKKDNASFFELLTQHPTGFWFIFWGEFAERCSYYGMRAILATYMADRLGLGKENAGLYMSFFIAACYFLPLLGGFLADNYFGKYNIIVAFSIPYILGHVILGIENQFAVVSALALLAMGSGVIKPNISTLMGLTYDQKRPGQDLLRTQAFSMFYMSINIGAFISQISIPWIKNNYGYFNAFLFPAALMVLAFIFFAIGKKHYAVEKIERRPSTPEESALRWSVLGQVGMLFLLVMFFWAIFDQSASTWIFYAETYMKTDFFMTAEQMQSINPLLIVAFLPVVNFLFTSMANSGWNVRATDKIVVGFVLTAVTMGIMAYCGYQTGQADRVEKVDTNGVVERGSDGNPVMVDRLPEERKVSLWWQAVAYFTLTIAEILISVTGLELAFVAAPKNMKSFVTSLWLLTVALANLLLNAPLSQFYPKMHPGSYFAMLAGMMGVVILAFFFVARQFNRAVEAQKQAEREMSAEEEMITTNLPPAGVSSHSGDGIQPAWKREGVQ